MKFLGAWQQLTYRRPLEATAFLVLLFTVLVVGFYALDEIAYDKAIPGALAGAIIALYLVTTLGLGLTTPLRVAGSGPPIGFFSGTFLWPILPWASFDDLTYDSGWAGAVLYTLLQTGIIWLVARFGANLGGRRQ